MENLRAKNTFHEIKNQISVCDLYLEVIKRTLEKKHLEDETLTRALKNIRNSLELIADSMNELNSAQIKEENLSALVEAAFELCKPYGEIEFINQVPTTTIFKLDKTKFLSVLVNIIKNAIEAKAKKIIISSEGNNILIENDGEKIPTENQTKIFEEGYSSKQSGSGLGLSLAIKQLEAQNLKLSLKKSTEELTIFNITAK